MAEEVIGVRSWLVHTGARPNAGSLRLGRKLIQKLLIGVAYLLELGLSLASIDTARHRLVRMPQQCQAPVSRLNLLKGCPLLQFKDGIGVLEDAQWQHE